LVGTNVKTKFNCFFRGHKYAFSATKMSFV
jgi:hypothetical protein